MLNPYEVGIKISPNVAHEVVAKKNFLLLSTFLFVSLFANQIAIVIGTLGFDCVRYGLFLKVWLASVGFILVPTILVTSLIISINDFATAKGFKLVSSIALNILISIAIFMYLGKPSGVSNNQLLVTCTVAMVIETLGFMLFGFDHVSFNWRRVLKVAVFTATAMSLNCAIGVTLCIVYMHLGS